MSELTQLPNIGKTLAKKIEQVGIHSIEQFMELGSEQVAIRLSSLDNHGLCINMLYAIEGAKQGIRWHGLDPNRKEELKLFLNQLLSE
jgi:DNA transformation protein